MDSSPIVAVTGQVARPFIGKDAFQETDIIGISAPITKHNLQPRSASEIPLAVKTAFYVAATGRPGPVLIDIPKDVQNEMCRPEFPGKVKMRSYNPVIRVSTEKVKEAIELLSEAERPVILAGGGVTVAQAFKELRELSETLMAPVGTSFMGKGAFPENHPLSIGMVGMHGNVDANKLITEADVLVAVGFRFSDRTTGRVEEFGVDTKIVHIDIDEAEVGKNKKADDSVIGDAKGVLELIVKGLQRNHAKANKKWRDRIEEVRRALDANAQVTGDKLRAPSVVKLLRRILPNEAIVTTEVGQNQMWAALYFKTYHPRTFISSGGLGTMGFGFPASLGAKVAMPQVPVVDIAGDGSFGMTENSLAVSVAENIPVIVVILNNRMLGMVAQWQRLFYEKRYSAVQLIHPDFVKLAEAYGAHGARVGSLEELATELRHALSSDVTTVVDVPIDPEEDVLPMIPPGGSMKDVIGVA